MSNYLVERYFDSKLQMSRRLIENLNTFKLVHGDKWKDVVDDVGTALQLRMKAIGETSHIAAAIPVAKHMSDDGVNPMLLLAVATDLAQQSEASTK